MSPLVNLILWNTGWAAVLAVIVHGLSLTSPFRNRPAVLHLLWFGVLLRLIVPPVVQIPILSNLEQPPKVTNSPEIVRTESKLGVDSRPTISVSVVPSDPGVTDPSIPSISEKAIAINKPAQSFEFRLSDTLVALSLGGTVALLTLCLFRVRRILRLLRESGASPPRFLELAERRAHRMKIQVVPRIRLVYGLATPSIWIGWRHSTILLPQHLVHTLDDDQWSCILAHELSHLARRDHWFNLAAAATMHLYWWNPIAWWAWRAMQSYQEACCDALAIFHEPQSRRLYAETLLQVVESWNRNSHVQPRVLLGFGNRSVLTRRFEMIANASVRPRAAVAATVCLALGALSFVCLPVRAEKKEQAATDQQNSHADDIGDQLPKDEPVRLTAPFNATEAKAAQEAWAKELEKNSIGMELVLIPPGTFLMGSPESEAGRQENEAQIEVTLTKPYYMAKTEVTQGQWKAVIGTAPWKGDESYVSQGDDFPATNISWDDAQAFCAKLSEKENATYRLPTEAEWEYACRAGTTTRFYTGDDAETLNDYEWWGGLSGTGSAKDEKYTHEVGRKLANPFGLHDMHGNVWEWCQDVHLRNHLGGTDPLVTAGDSHRTFRGGVWAIGAASCRSAHRRWMLPVDLDNGLGFRVVRIYDK